MGDTLGGKPVSWDPADNWQERAKRIAAFLRQQEPRIRAIGVSGDYAAGDLSPASVLTLLVFFPDYRPDYTLGTVQSMEGMPVALDWVTTAYLVETEPILEDDLRAHRLATLQPLAVYDAVLRGVLTEFRDRYFSREERERRLHRLLSYALQRLDMYRRDGHAVDAVNAFLWGYGPALCHLVDEPPSRRRLLVRFRDAARVRRLRPAVEATVDAFGLDRREPQAVLAATENLRAFAEEHVRERHNEAIGGLLPTWASDLAKARQALSFLMTEGEVEAAVFAAMAAGVAVDTLAAREVPGFHGRAGYAETVRDLFGLPDEERLREAMRQVRATASV